MSAPSKQNLDGAALRVGIIRAWVNPTVFRRARNWTPCDIPISKSARPGGPGLTLNI